jgi:hypothetical protein
MNWGQLHLQKTLPQNGWGIRFRARIEDIQHNFQNFRMPLLIYPRLFFCAIL